jgi:hypothetical protein
VTNSERNWLGAVPWESVVSLNKALCQAQKLEPLHNAKGFSAAQRLWEASISKKLSLRAVIEVCHETFELAPFTFNNGNTFAAIARTLLEEPLKQISPVEAQIVRTTVCHYIVDLIGAKELQQVLRHFEAKLVSGPAERKPETASAPAPVPQEQRV